MTPTPIDFKCTFYTESLDPQDARARVVLDKRAPAGYTLYHGHGYWEGQHESNLTVVVILRNVGETEAHGFGDSVAAELAEALDQQCVLWTLERAQVAFIDRAGRML